MTLDFTFTATLWLYPAKAAWTFATVPLEAAEKIKFFTQTGLKRGFGSVRVSARIGETKWKTSLFPDKESGAYFLPIKAAVRKAERVEAGDDAEIQITVLTSL